MTHPMDIIQETDSVLNPVPFDTILFLGVWERIYNPDFNSLEFEGIRNEAGRNSFFLSARKWIDRTGAIFYAKACLERYGEARPSPPPAPVKPQPAAQMPSTAKHPKPQGART